MNIRKIPKNKAPGSRSCCGVLDQRCVSRGSCLRRGFCHASWWLSETWWCPRRADNLVAPNPLQAPWRSHYFNSCHYRKGNCICTMKTFPGRYIFSIYFKQLVSLWTQEPDTIQTQHILSIITNPRHKTWNTISHHTHTTTAILTQ